ncbi:hypothetical protein OROHE_025167 [Orobanche hederae]
MGKWEEGSWVWEVGWRRGLGGRDAEAATELHNWLRGITLKQQTADSWKWGDKSGGSYTVKEAYEVIAKSQGEELMEEELRRLFRKLWKSEAPWKHKVAAWRMLWNRLPTRENLARRLHFGDEDILCPSCKELPEHAKHILLRCCNSSGVWEGVLRWIGVEWAAPGEIQRHFEGFMGLLRGKVAGKAMGGLWCCVMWVIWRWRNKLIFDNWEWDVRRIDEEIKCRFWCWCVITGNLDRNMSLLDWSRLRLCELWNL